MNYEELTQAQRDALKVGVKTTTVYDKTNMVTDSVTGEILRQETTQLTKSTTEPDYVKLYYTTMLAFNGASDIPLDFIVALSSHLTYTNGGSDMVFSNTASSADDICETLGIKNAMYKRYVKRCVDHGLLVRHPKYRGTYLVNPFFIARGKWESIKMLRTSFDFFDGRWTRVSGEPMEIDTMTPVKQNNNDDDHHQMSFDDPEIKELLNG